MIDTRPRTHSAALGSLSFLENTQLVKYFFLNQVKWIFNISLESELVPQYRMLQDEFENLMRLLKVFNAKKFEEGHVKCQFN